MITKALNTNLIKLVNILNDGQYHDGTTIGEKLNMTRSAVWKAIKKLESYDIKIDSVKGRGYALIEPLILLEAKKIQKNLAEKMDISVYETLPSTSEYLKAFKRCNKIKICLAEHQSAGKGRLGREWYSPFGKNIYLSCLFPFEKDVSELAGLSLVTGLALMKTLNGYCIQDKLFAKWPNDIMYDNKKLCGTLIEIQAETHDMCHAIIGIGLDVNLLHDDEQIAQDWTSMRKILGIYLDRNEVCARMIDNLIDYLQRFLAHGFAPFMEEWTQADYLAQKVVALKSLTETFQGKVLGINEQGHLLVQLTNGRLQAFSSGDTSILKK